MNNAILKQILGVLLLPFVVSIFVLDRLVSMPLFWITSLKFMTWIRKDDEVFYSLIRVIVGGTIFFIWYLL